MHTGQLDILMYHSISENPGPTNIPPSTFAEQMAAISDAGVPVIGLGEVLDARAGGQPLPHRAVIITFDDGFQDFADTAWPILQDHGYSAINYLPTRFIGEHDGWEGNANPRPIMTWATILDIHADGAGFGSHGVSHKKLNSCSLAELDRELALSKQLIEEKLQNEVVHFAPPFGVANRRVRIAISDVYQTSVGTYLDRARSDGDLFNLPRIEMHYFRNPSQLRKYLTSDGSLYLSTRRFLRRAGAVWRAIAKSGGN